uniref:Exocyst complex component Sec8 n=1 Tax=Haemonchus contortus TaxID=6289 RepID=A0A7I4YQH0_HAECO
MPDDNISASKRISAHLRRQIGAVRKQLTHVIELCQNDLQDDVHTFISSTNNYALLDYIAIQHNHRETIIAKLDKLQRLNDEWSTLMTADNDEVAVFNEYIFKYGDYRLDINRAIELLERIDTHEVLIAEHLGQQGIDYEPKLSSDEPQQQINGVINGNGKSSYSIKFIVSLHLLPPNRDTTTTTNSTTSTHHSYHD